ncbi:hypothetical protein [Prosthecobacter sp.]|uniref:hypothetical protein n=1 Tax=Prosthecobacter sp. TaxID=1965333 RepID=UPI002ABC484E|nr:hypothetical protein [Prosthecobacter sp.]MDZ4405020.1 hypothetical protein [Prosthecobacter sp.]
MKASIAGGVIHSTDYFSSRDRDEGRAWLVMHLTDWHVLLPHGCPRLPTAAHARPVTDCHEQDGWRWRLELGDWSIPLPRRQIIGPRPFLPDPYSITERTLTLYGSELSRNSGQSFFGSVEPGVQVHAVSVLYLVRETRHGEKPKDRHSALSRYHAKMRQREGHR